MSTNILGLDQQKTNVIAKELNVSENTSKSQYSRARSYLKKKLEELNFER